MQKKAYLLLLLLLLLAAAGEAVAQQLLQGWQYRMPVLVRNREAKVLENYQVSFLFSADSLVEAGKLLPDLSDLRITDSDGTSALCFWPERLNEQRQVRVWVKVLKLLANEQKQLFVYYGNHTALAAADGSCTFLLFDDFNSTQFDHSQWEPLGLEEPQLQQGALILRANEADCMLRSRYSFRKPVIVEMEVKRAKGNMLGLLQLNRSELGWISGYSLTLDAAYNNMRMDQVQLSPCSGYEPGYGHSLPQTAGTTAGNWSMAWITDTQVIGHWPGGDIIEDNVLRGADQIKIALGVMACNTNQPLQGELVVDWVRIRQYTQLEPEVLLGSEMVAGNSEKEAVPEQKPIPQPFALVALP